MQTDVFVYIFFICDFSLCLCLKFKCSSFLVLIMWVIITFLLFFGILSLLFLTLSIFLGRLYFCYCKNQNKKGRGNIKTVGFFHPYCNAGGGGERVLWTAIKAVQIKYSNVHCVIYTGDVTFTKDEIINNVQRRFNIVFPREIDFVYLNTRGKVEAKLYPYFTILMQSLASLIVGMEALWKFVPDIYIDTMGYAFTIPIFKYLGSCKTACYVHYPTISTDMLEAVKLKRPGVNNNQTISQSPARSLVKVVYYKYFAKMYHIMGKRSDVVMVNSTWTEDHIISLWKQPQKVYLVHPPCDISEFCSFGIPDVEKNERILSIAQFRPEKDHTLQIKAFNELVRRRMEKGHSLPTLVLAGSCRGLEDEQRVEKLKELCNKLQIEKYVEFKVNLSFEELLDEMKRAGIALHTMWNEHFGIGVVEGMAAGHIMIAHNSGGPKLDIVVDYEGQKTGFLADDVESYANTMQKVLEMPEEEQYEIRQNARKSVERFSSEKFINRFLKATQCLFV